MFVICSELSLLVLFQSVSACRCLYQPMRASSELFHGITKVSALGAVCSLSTLLYKQKLVVLQVPAYSQYYHAFIVLPDRHWLCKQDRKQTQGCQLLCSRMIP